MFRSADQPRRRLSYANVAATLALLLALGAGAAYASGYVITSTGQIKPSVLHKLQKPGPKGATGQTGATGAPGTPGTPGVARDAGAVAAASQGGPKFYSEGLVGWQSVTSPSTGVYCLTPDSTSTTGNTTLLLSPGNGSGAAGGIVSWNGYCDHSGAIGLEVDTQNDAGTLENDIGFTAVIPTP